MSKTEGAKAPNMNDYYRVAFSVSPANTDACDLLAAFLFGYRREVVVLHRLHVFAAAAGVQVGYDFVPGFGGFFLPRVGGLVVYPAQDGRRYDEQNQDE